MGLMTGDDLHEGTAVGMCFTFRQFDLALLLSPSLGLQPQSISTAMLWQLLTNFCGSQQF